MKNDGIVDSVLGSSRYGAFTSVQQFNATQINGLIVQTPEGFAFKWNDGTPGPLSITYSFFGHGTPGIIYYDPDEYEPGSEISSVFRFTQQQIDNITSALATWEAVVAVDFQFVLESSTRVGDIRFGNSGNVGLPDYAHAFMPNQSDAAFQGDVWFQHASIGSSSFAPGSYEFHTVIHEVGHAVFGFADISSYAFGSGRTYTGLNHVRLDGSAWDTKLWTNMSYNGTGVRPMTPMYLDIVAGQAIYGAPASGVNSGNNNYHFSSQTIAAVWDTGGTDTIIWDDFVACDLDLTTVDTVFLTQNGGVDPTSQVGWSGVANGAFDQQDWRIYIAPISTIENATGGSGADLITGNSANNVLTGRGGNDTISGGAGTDTAVFSGARSAYTINTMGATIQVIGLDGTDSLSDIEFLRFDDQTITAPTIRSTNASLSSLYQALLFNELSQSPQTDQAFLSTLNQATLQTAQDLLIRHALIGPSGGGSAPGATAAAYQFLLGGVPNEGGFFFLIDRLIDTDFGRLIADGVVTQSSAFNTENRYINLFNSLVQGNTTAEARLANFIADDQVGNADLIQSITNIYDAMTDTMGALTFLTRPEALQYYRNVAAERILAGENNSNHYSLDQAAAIVAAGAIASILVRDEIGGLGSDVHNLFERISLGNSPLPKIGTNLTDISNLPGLMVTQAMGDFSPTGAQANFSDVLDFSDTEASKVVGIVWEAG